MDVFSTIPLIIMPKNAACRIKNWKKYNDALVARGSLTLWVSDDVLEGWMHRGPKHHGRPFVFSDSAIECALTLRAVFRLPLRQTEGFLASVFGLLRLSLPIPDYSTLCVRGKTLKVTLPTRTNRPLHLILDSTGLKIRGEGEWKRKIHGLGNHRRWRKLSIALNPATHEIEAVALTHSRVHDSTHVPQLLKQVEKSVASVTADGSYDRINVYYALWKREIPPVIPPRKDAKIRRYRRDPGDGKWKKHVPCMDPRDANVRAVRKAGRRRWKRESGYHRRSLVETAMFRLQRAFGSDLRCRTIAAQRTEVAIRCKALNRMTHTGMPESVRMT